MIYRAASIDYIGIYKDCRGMMIFLKCLAGGLRRESPGTEEKTSSRLRSPPTTDRGNLKHFRRIPGLACGSFICPYQASDLVSQYCRPGNWASVRWIFQILEEYRPVKVTMLR